MKYYVIAGEASGDLHGSNLIKELKKKDAGAVFRVWGGNLMAETGSQLVKHYRDLAFMGFVEVLMNIRMILRNIRFCKQDIDRFQPDVLILIDYPGFNLRIAKWAKKKGYLVFYYISPQIWAWHTSRVHKIKANINRMLVILPFEKDFYKKYGVDVDFVGHPLLDVIENYSSPGNFRKECNLSDRPLIALLPGSRKQEIKRVLGELLKIADAFPGHEFVIAGAPAIPAEFYDQIIAGFPNLRNKPKLVINRTYDLLAIARAALVTSGTATLETALFGVPQTVCYKGSYLSYQIARRVIKVEYISLVNLIAGKKIVEELIQDQVNTKELKKSLTILLSQEALEKFGEEYQLLRKKLGGKGASGRAAFHISQEVK